MIPLPLARIAEITSGALSGMADPRAVVRGPVVIDSRAVEPGSLFVAIRGDRVDGHDYAAQAIRAGAVAVLATRPVDAPSVIVADAVDALTALATEVASVLPATVIGVTGSAGKTSTKDLLARLTGRIGATIAPVGSLNNEIGKAKGELVEALPRTGVAILNADDPLVREMAARTQARVTFFGRGESAAVRATDVRLDERGRASFTLTTPSGSAEVALRLYGEHAVSNALAAAAAAYELGLPITTIAQELSLAEPASRWRMEVGDRPDGVTVINDSYNANPDSMRAAFQALGAMGQGRRRFAVIAALRELGEESAALNEELGRLAGGAGLDGLIVAGPDAEPVLRGAYTAAGGLPYPPQGLPIVHVADAAAAAAQLGTWLRPGDVVLVKGPRAMELQRTAELLLGSDAK